MDKKIRRPAVPEFPSLVCQVFFGYLQGDRKMCKNKVVNAGKTTLITRLLPVLTDYGLKVATVKTGMNLKGMCRGRIPTGI